jgi:hypothetical protein
VSILVKKARSIFILTGKQIIEGGVEIGLIE